MGEESANSSISKVFSLYADHIKQITKRKISNSSKLKAFADDKLNVAQK